MKFLDLEKMEVVDYDNTLPFKVESGGGSVSLDDDLPTFNQKINKMIEECVWLDEEEKAPILFSFYVEDETEDEMNEEEEEDFFMTIVNLTVAAVFNCVCLAEERDREKRLAVPDELAAACHANLSQLKQGINHKSLVERFSINIDFKDSKYLYKMVD